MAYNLASVRALLRQFAIVDQAREIFSADGVVLSPIGDGSGEDLYAHADQLVAVGMLQRTNDIHMSHGADPVTLRITDAGRIWVRRAYDDAAWQASEAELRSILDS